MLHYISADCIHPVVGAPLLNGVLGLETDGTIREVLSLGAARSRGLKNINHYKGHLVPGFVNTHCHLELSHLKGKIEKHTGLPKFVEQVIKQRSATADQILKAMTEADQQMFDQGIVATGDISNQIVSKKVKQASAIYYHTFIEVLGFDPSRAPAIVAASLKLKEEFSPLRASVVPHAPYSVSTALFKEIANVAVEDDDLGSIHNQETEAERLFFKDRTGGFLELYERLGLDISFFKPSGKSSLETILPLLSRRKTLLVHNTCSEKSDVLLATAAHPSLYWCLCPNANLYIENRLPDVHMLMEAGIRLTLGTDSLASNNGLSILDEMKTLQMEKHLLFFDLLKWATYNGAEFLGIEVKYGSLEPGKKPGINLISNFDGILIQEETTVQRLY